MVVGGSSATAESKAPRHRRRGAILIQDKAMTMYLHLRFEAPIALFTMPAVDARGVCARMPGPGQIAGLIGNAMGWTYEAEARTIDLARRLRPVLMVARRAGEPMRDYQTADLGQAHMSDDLAWTTRGRLERRGGSPAVRLGTALRARAFLSDIDISMLIGIDGHDDGPAAPEIDAALRSPARPLFIGAKTCLPTRPLAAGYAESVDGLAAEALTDAWECVAHPLSSEARWQDLAPLAACLLRLPQPRSYAGYRLHGDEPWSVRSRRPGYQIAPIIAGAEGPQSLSIYQHEVRAL